MVHISQLTMTRAKKNDALMKATGAIEVHRGLGRPD